MVWSFISLKLMWSKQQQLLNSWSPSFGGSWMNPVGVPLTESMHPPRPQWCLDQPAKNESEPVYLGAVIPVRIWPHTDLANLTFIDLPHWMTYMRYAGVERIYDYDCYHNNQKVEQTLQRPAI
jgi:hypothetical protein